MSRRSIHGQSQPRRPRTVEHEFADQFCGQMLTDARAATIAAEHDFLAVCDGLHAGAPSRFAASLNAWTARIACITLTVLGTSLLMKLFNRISRFPHNECPADYIRNNDAKCCVLARLTCVTYCGSSVIRQMGAIKVGRR